MNGAHRSKAVVGQHGLAAPMGILRLNNQKSE
jgi:hypothetical protein